MSDYVHGLCFVEQVEVLERSAEAVKVRVRGWWPTPAWKFDHEEVVFSEGRIIVKLIGKARRGVAAPAVMTPFEHVVEIKGPKVAECILEVVGRGGRVVKAQVKQK